MTWKRVVLSAGLAMAIAIPADAQRVLYVNGATGNDNVPLSSNSASTPWRTIGRASWGSTNRNSPNAAEAARAGDTIMVAGGTYSFGGTISDRWGVVYNPVNQGTSGSPIVFRAQGAVRLTAPSTRSPVIGCHERNYIIWEGQFELDEAQISVTADTGTVVLAGGTGCGVDGIFIDGNGMPSYVDNHTGVRVESCQSCFVRNSTITDVRHQRGNHNGSAVMLYNSDNTLIEHNYIYSVDNAVFIKGVFGVSDYQSGTIVRRNLMENCDECVTVSDSRASRIYQNVIRNSVIGVNLLAREAGAYYHPVDDWVVNNTVDGMSQACIFVNGGDWHENVRVWNNVLSNCFTANYRSGGPFTANQARIDWEHNVYGSFSLFGDDSNPGEIASFSQWRSAYGHDGASPASVNANPQYVNPASGDFRLCEGPGAPGASCAAVSPASIGVDILDVDGDGSTSDTIRAGAYVTNAEVIGPATGLPRAPRGLTIRTP